MFDGPPADTAREAPLPRAFGAENLEEIIARFRTWHAELTAPPEVRPVAEPFAIGPLVAQLVALRHDANLQTKAYRALSEKLAQTTTAEPLAPTNPDSIVRPLAKLVLDIHDALSAALRQIRMSQSQLVSLPELPELLPQTTQKRWWQFFATPSSSEREPPAELLRWQAELQQASQKLGDQLRGISSGYELSLKRIERVLPEFGFERIDCLNQAFDPAVCEVLDTITTSNHAAGTVLEVVREGYRVRGELFRFAQVKVAVN